jgi:hypothetical protein
MRITRERSSPLRTTLRHRLGGPHRNPLRRRPGTPLQTNTGVREVPEGCLAASCRQATTRCARRRSILARPREARSVRTAGAHLSCYGRIGLQSSRAVLAGCSRGNAKLVAQLVDTTSGKSTSWKVPETRSCSRKFRVNKYLGSSSVLAVIHVTMSKPQQDSGGAMCRLSGTCSVRELQACGIAL